ASTCVETPEKLNSLSLFSNRITFWFFNLFYFSSFKNKNVAKAMFLFLNEEKENNKLR
ncbi:MAG: hypothetical protein ACJAZ2_000960, partial [Glaciecola sp.]